MSGQPALRVTAFRPLQRNTLVGHCMVEQPSGMILRDVAIHTRDGKWWASPPAKPILVEGKHALDDNGKGRWQTQIEFRSRAIRDRWSDAVVEALRIFAPATFDRPP
jgi:hypothetical protein